MRKITSLLFIFFAVYNLSHTQIYNPVHWEFSSKQISSTTYELSFTASIDKGWHMYGLNIPENGPVPTSFYFSESDGYDFLDQISSQQKPVVKYDPSFEMDLELFGGQVSFVRQVQLTGKGTSKIEGSIEFMACDDTKCLPPKEESFEFLIKQVQSEKTHEQEATKALPSKIQSVPAFETKKLEVNDLEGISIAEEVEVEMDQTDTEPISDAGTDNKDKSLLGLFLLALAAGLGALLTPCVYPIIPLTVSFFMRDTKRSKAIYNGLAFGISIVLIYTLVGLIVGILKIDLVRLVSSHWIPNLIFLLIFLALAFSFFGMFEITLPGSLSNKIDQQAEKGGFLGPFFMALATVIISFSCTGPIVGVLLGSALQGEIIRPVVGMLGFSLTFALPFTLLAIFPGFMKKLPKSGGWLNSVKVFFAFILTAFALVFLSNLGLGFITRDLIISLYIVIFALLGVYLLGKIKFSHDSDLPYVSVPRLMLAIISFAFALWMVPGLFGAPLKAISPFLPEKTESSFDLSATSVNTGPATVHAESNSKLCDDSPKYSDFLHTPLGLNAYFDYEEALACSKELNKPVLLDFAGHSCKNCKKMYAEVWSDPAVLNSLSNDFIIAVLFTDDRTKLAEEDQVTSTVDGKVKNTIGKKFNDLQIEKFGSNALPLYAIVDSEGEILTSKKYHTYSPDVNAFLEFMKEGIESFKGEYD